jgi:hypothetical protein
MKPSYLKTHPGTFVDKGLGAEMTQFTNMGASYGEQSEEVGSQSPE